MLTSAEEFKALRESSIPEEYGRAAHEEAAPGVWTEVLAKYPELAVWVAHNKTVPTDILEILASNKDVEVRWMVARKRKLPVPLMERLAEDEDESVRLGVAINAKTPGHVLEKLMKDQWQAVRKVACEKLALLKSSR